MELIVSCFDEATITYTDGGWTPIEDADGIPLTDQTMVRLGFKKSLIGWLNDSFIIGLRQGGSFVNFNSMEHQCSFTIAIIKYVHELQTIYYVLKGRELPWQE